LYIQQNCSFAHTIVSQTDSQTTESPAGQKRCEQRGTIEMQTESDAVRFAFPDFGEAEPGRGLYCRAGWFSNKPARTYG
jgi:hypothetical protein